MVTLAELDNMISVKKGVSVSDIDSAIAAKQSVDTTLPKSNEVTPVNFDWSLPTTGQFTPVDFSGSVEMNGQRDLNSAFQIDDPEMLEWTGVMEQAIQNVPSSATALVKDTLTALFNPIDTVKAVGKVGVGFAQKLLPGEQEYERNANLAIDYMKDRYGGIEEAKKSIAQDPVGVVSDVVGFLVPGGAVLKGAGATAKINALTKAGRVAQAAGKLIDPLNLAGKALPSVSTFIPKKLPTNLYKKGIKFHSSIPDWKADDLIKVALDNEIVPTANSMEKLRAKINVKDKEITDKINVASRSGKRVDMVDFLDGMEEVVDSIIDPTENKMFNTAISGVIDRQTMLRKGDQTMSVASAQKLKQNLYKKMEKAYEKLNQKPIKTEARMSLANGIKRSLEKAVMETTGADIKALNFVEGELIDLRKAIDARISTINKGDIIPFNTVGRSLVGGAVGGPAGATAGLGLGIISSPVIQTKLAVVANKLKKRGIVVAPKTPLGKLLVTPISTGGRAVGAASQRAGLQEVTNESN